MAVAIQNTRLPRRPRRLKDGSSNKNAGISPGPPRNDKKKIGATLIEPRRFRFEHSLHTHLADGCCGRNVEEWPLAYLPMAFIARSTTGFGVS